MLNGFDRHAQRSADVERFNSSIQSAELDEARRESEIAIEDRQVAPRRVKGDVPTSGSMPAGAPSADRFLGKYDTFSVDA